MKYSYQESLAAFSRRNSATINGKTYYYGHGNNPRAKIGKTTYSLDVQKGLQAGLIGTGAAYWVNRAANTRAGQTAILTGIGVKNKIGNTPLGRKAGAGRRAVRDTVVKPVSQKLGAVKYALNKGLVRLIRRK
jgi:hypothetical protein